MKDLLFFSETFAKMNRFHYNKGKSYVKKIGRRMMKKIDAHLHLTWGFFQKRNWLIFIMATRKEFISRQTTWRL